MSEQTDPLWDLLASVWEAREFHRFSLTGPVEREAPQRKYVLRPVEVHGEILVQWTASDSRNRQTHENLPWSESLARLQSWFGARFSSGHLKTAREEIQLRLLPSGRLQWKRQTVREPQAPPPMLHNRQREYLLPEGQPIPFLVATGIMMETGQVRRAHYRKFRQINRFLEFVHDLRERFPRDRPMRVVDYGCGKSYLTFAVRHLLVEILGLQVEMLGLDSNPDVIASCLETRDQLEWTDLEFRAETIASAPLAAPVDLAIWLHACDIATDHALARSIEVQAETILAVPCCQHELHHQLQHAELAPLLEHGILRERWAALCTDALRAKLLEAQGYRTQVLEFIDLEHTAKNLLIRAQRSPLSPDQRQAAQQAYTTMKQALGITQFALEEMLEMQRGSSE